MESIEVTMTRADLNNIPQYSLHPDFKIEHFQEGDQAAWIHVETITDEFPDEEAAWSRFNREFGYRLDEFSTRCLMLKTKDGQIIGTTSAWYGKLEDDQEPQGRIHWVSILPKYQGRGLAKPLLTAAMNLLAKHHTKAYLDSETKNYRAINMYLQYGFEPYIRTDEDLKAWTIIEDLLGKKILNRE